MGCREKTRLPWTGLGLVSGCLALLGSSFLGWPRAELFNHMMSLTLHNSGRQRDGTIFTHFTDGKTEVGKVMGFARGTEPVRGRAEPQAQVPRIWFQRMPSKPLHPCSLGPPLSPAPPSLFPLSVWYVPTPDRGRFGVVRACRENATGRTFVAKIVPYAAEGKRRVLQEYEVLRTLQHERLMALHEAYITPRYLVLIAESCGNRELLCGLSDRYLGDLGTLAGVGGGS